MTYFYLFIILTLILASTNTFSQDSDVLDNLSLDDVLNMNISVAAKKNSTLRESPGIISVITSEDIAASGAQDLIDVLRLVPGITFNLDVQNFVGITMRGNWANEGKVLVILDGVPLNELMFGCAPFGNRVFISTIDKIEIIRGPGSAQYGGLAMLGVIKITTKNAKQLQGVTANFSEGRAEGGISTSRNVNVAAGVSLGEADITLSAYYGSALRGVGIYRDFDGTAYQTSEFSTTTLKGVNIGIQSASTSLRCIADEYSIGNIDSRISQPFVVGFRSISAELSHRLQLAQGCVLSPRIMLLHQTPWTMTGDEAIEAGLYYNRSITRSTASLGLDYDLAPGANVQVGLEYNDDMAITPENMRQTSYFGTDTLLKKTHLNFSLFSLYGQLTINTSIANITLGARYEENTRFYGAFTPRIAITKQVGDFHAKALFARAFRSPVIENLSANSAISPEMSNNAEIEIGYQFSSHFFARTNVFYTTIDKPIIFSYDGLFGTYYNGERSGSYGLESEIAYKSSSFDCLVGYSMYKRFARDVQSYVIPGKSSGRLGIPDYKLTLVGTLKLSESATLSVTQMFLGENFSFTYNDITGNSLTRFDPSSLVNISFRCVNILSSGIDIRATIHNAFNSSLNFLSTVNNPDTQIYPVSDLPRTFQFQCVYTLR